MAYTKTPENSTYKTQRFNFVGSPQQRDGSTTRDQRFVNLMPEVVKTDATKGTKYYLKSRAGTYIYNAVAAGEGRGIWMFNSNMVVAVGDKVYRDGVAILTWTSTTTGRVGFAEGDTTTYQYLFITDGIEAYVLQEDGTTTKVTDADMPTPHLPFPVFIDGYLTLVKASTGDIYNSDLNDPLTWTAGNFITAEMFPDDVMAITKHLNYIAAFGRTNIEFFYDAANASGSPFERNSGAVQMVGTISPQSIASSENQIAFVGNARQGGNSVWVLEGFKLTDVATEAVRVSLDREGPVNIANAHGFCIRTKGHRLYVLNLTTRTWVYDFEEKLWHEWQYNDSVFPFNYVTTFKDSDSLSYVWMVHPTTGGIYKMGDDTSNDDAYPLDCYVTTVKVDFDTYNRKFCHRFALIGDNPSTSGLTTPVYVSWSDDDYRTFSTERVLSFTDTSAMIQQLGSFRRRAFKIRLRNVPVRLEGFELDINVGNA